MAEWSISNLRAILAGETDYDSPHSQTLNDGLRHNIEAILLLCFGTGITGTVSGISETVLTDSGKSWSADDHNGRTLLMTSGSAIGNMYTIDDTGITTLTCTGDTMVTDGVSTSDTYAILYDIKTNLDGHDHDDVNSRMFTIPNDYINSQHYAAGSIDEEHMASDSVDSTALKTTHGQTNVALTADDYETLSMTNGSMMFMPRFYKTGSGTLAITATTYQGWPTGAFGASASAGSVSLKETGATYSATAYGSQYYVTASGREYWYFILTHKDTGLVIRSSCSLEHPKYFDPLADHPFGDLFDPAKHDLHLAMISPDVMGDIISEYSNDYSLVGLSENFALDLKHKAEYPKYEISIGREFTGMSEKNRPTFKKARMERIYKPDYVNCCYLKESHDGKSLSDYFDDFKAKHGVDHPK